MKSLSTIKTWNWQRSIPTIHINNQYYFLLGNYNNRLQQRTSRGKTTQKTGCNKEANPEKREIGVASKWQCEGRKPFGPRTLKAAKVGAKTGRKWDRAAPDHYAASDGPIIITPLKSPHVISTFDYGRIGRSLNFDFRYSCFSNYAQQFSILIFHSEQTNSLWF